MKNANVYRSHAVFIKADEKLMKKVFPHTLVSKNEECLKTVRTGDSTVDNLINFREQNEIAIKKYGKMGNGTVSCILQLINDSRRNNNNESVKAKNPEVIFFDIDESEKDVDKNEKDSSLKQKKSVIYHR